MEKKVFDIIYKDHFRVAIFGSARLKRSSPEYKQIYSLGKKLGKRGFNLVTGGGPGLMEAAHRGHLIGSKENEAYSLGLAIKLPFEEKKNISADIRKEFNYFSDRLDHFIALSNAVIVAPGGIGTLLEFTYTWQLIQVGHLYKIPIILLGPDWHELVKWLKKNLLIKKGYISKKDFSSIFSVKDIKEAMSILSEEYEIYKKGERKMDINIIRDKIRQGKLSGLK